jgi:tetratricopeptide (TPR) repeat protein
MIELNKALAHCSSIFKPAFFLLIAGFLSWRIITLGFADHYALQDGSDDIDRALSWYPDKPAALFEKGLRLSEQGDPNAETLLINSIRMNPTNARTYIGLAEIWEKQGLLQQASDLFSLADQLAPRRVPVQLAVASYKLRQGQLDQTLHHLNIVLTLRRRLRQSVYPFLLHLLEDPQARSALSSLLEEAPNWWGDFFIHTVNKAEKLDTVRTLYRLIRAHNQSIDISQRRRYVTRLQREQQWLEAYFVWLNHLDTKQREALGNVYNGNFELPLSDEDFGWRTPSVKGAWVDTSTTDGAQGRSLRIMFRDEPERFRHLYQRLALSPGRYRLQGLLKLDSLQTKQGIQWQLKCHPKRLVLGSSERFLGLVPWQPFFFDFEVPATGCLGQELRLESTGHFTEEFRVRGTAWFDAMSIIRKVQ